MAWNALLVTLAAVFWSLSGCASLENRLLYHPDPCQEKQYTPPPPPLMDVVLRTTEGTEIHARWFYHLGSQGAVLFCHGNAGNVEEWSRAAQRLGRALRKSVLLFDYPGYGYSGGKPSEAGCYAAAAAAYAWLRSDRKIPPGCIVVYGESLGGGVAVDLASHQPHRALVLVRTFASLPDVAQTLFPLVPVRALMSSHFDNLDKIGRCHQPTFIAQADADHLMPFEHGQRLQAASGGPVEFLRLKGLDHNDPLPYDFYPAVRRFLQTRAPAELDTWNPTNAE